MKLVLVGRGSRGDVLPIIAIAGALHRLGHQVELCVAPFFETAARRAGLEPRLYHEDIARAMAEMGSSWEASKQALRWMSRGLEERAAVVLEAARGAEVLVTGHTEPTAPTVAEALGIPHFRVAYCPVLIGSGPPPLLPWPALPPAANRLIWIALTQGIGLLARGQLERVRRRLGLPPIRSLGDYFAARSHTLLAISPTLSPPDPEWRHPYSYTGAIEIASDGELPDEVLRFVQAGPAPIYLGFGSVTIKHPRRITEAAVRAAREVGCRLILSRGWTGLGRGGVSGEVLCVGELPHARLFPGLAGVVHAGGSGTVHTAARAGVPQVILPQFADQFYWGHRLQRLGVAPAALTGRITWRRLAESFQALLQDRALSQRARELSRQLAHEHGLTTAVERITRAGALSIDPLRHVEMEGRFGPQGDRSSSACGDGREIRSEWGSILLGMSRRKGESIAGLEQVPIRRGDSAREHERSELFRNGGG